MIERCEIPGNTKTLVLNLPERPSFNNPETLKIYKRLYKLYGNDKIGVLVSGGMDSALLYFLLMKLNLESGNTYRIKPYTILRKEGSRNYAIKVIDWIHDYFSLPRTQLNIVGDNSLPEIQQVESGVREILARKIDYVYVGIIKSRPEHSIGWNRYEFKESLRIRYPFLDLEKCHVLDLFRSFDTLDLLNYTHSCAVDEINHCGVCNGCNERSWAFDVLEIKDPRMP